MNIITVSNEIRCEKPPEYETVASLMPPSYDDAIKLNPSLFLASSSTSTSGAPVHLPSSAFCEDTGKEESSSTVYHPPPHSSSSSVVGRNCSSTPPPVYTITTAMPNEVVTYEQEERVSSRRCSFANSAVSR